jgi:hypothetical protein
LDYSKTPHVCFKIDRASNYGGSDVLPQALALQLRTRIESIQLKKTPLFGSSTIVMTAGQESFTAVMDRSKYGNDEWVLLIAPSSGPRLMSMLRPRKPHAVSSNLVQVCRLIHSSLGEIPGVTAVRWYFEGFRSQSAAVAQPDELPWGQEEGQ